MRRSIFVVVAAVLSLAPVPAARAGLVMIYADTLGITCDDPDIAAGTQDIYILHWVTAASAVRFRLETSPGMTWTYVSEELYAPVLEGDLWSGITFCYGGCRQFPVVLAKVTYVRHGTSAVCSEIRVIPRASGFNKPSVTRGFSTWGYGKFGHRTEVSPIRGRRSSTTAVLASVGVWCEKMADGPKGPFVYFVTASPLFEQG